jgi:PHD/YefM family antitoxin component YafN of YafNO toxin-antitoxin module
MKTTVKKEPRYITDKKGKKLSVVISIAEYNQMIEELEELEDIRLYDAVKARKEKSIPFEQYLQQRSRKKKNA